MSERATTPTVPRLRLATTLALLAGLAALPVFGQAPEEPPPESPGQSFYDQGRELYGARDYAGALGYLVQAIQADPSDPRYWIGAARAANFSDQLDLSVRLYDDYIAHFSEHAEAARRRADRLRAVQRERDEVNQRRPNPEAPLALPPEQTAARATFVERLTTGPAIAVDGSGAYTIYRTLLRTGYVSYDLHDLRAQLADGILAQLSSMFEPGVATPVLVMELEGWEAVPTWYEAVAALGRPVLAEPPVQARLAAAEGQRQLLNGNYDIAAEQFRGAIALDPTLVMAHIGALMSGHRRVQYHGCCLDPAGMSAHLAAIEAGLPATASYRVGLMSLLRGMVAADTGSTNLAAGYLMPLFTDRVDPEEPASWRAPPPSPAPTTQPSGPEPPATEVPPS